MTEFRLKTFYPNYFALRRALEEYLTGKPPGNGETAFPAPELEYRKAGTTDLTRIPLNVTDALILCQPDRSKARKFLDLLVASVENHPGAAQKKENFVKQYLAVIKWKFFKPEFSENDLVVPAPTSNSYDERLLSQKGKVLLDLYNQGYPVPDFCILTSQAYQLDETDREACLMEAVVNLEKMTGQKLGDPENSLVFAMRSATPYYIPGLMPTYLNAGITKDSYRSLEILYGREVADKIYLNNLQSLCHILSPGQQFLRMKRKKCLPPHEEVEDRIQYLFRQLRSIDERILYDAKYQVKRFMENAFGFFTRNLDLIYTFQPGMNTFPSVILQKMVWTVRNRDSYPGVLYSRHPRTGLGVQIESVREIFGEDIMTGIIHAEQREFFDREEIREEFPAIYHFTPLLPLLEVKLKSPATVEFGVESFEGVSMFAILQLNTSELTGRSTLLSAIDLYQKKIISKRRVVHLVRPYHLRQIFSERIDDESFKSLVLFGTGISVLPRSAMSAKIYFSMAKALQAKKKGEKVCLCKEDFIPSETIFMGELDAIMSMSPLAIHVVTACLGYGIPALIDLKSHHMSLSGNSITNDSGMIIREGDWITVSSKRRSVYSGKANYKPARFQKYLEGVTLEMDQKEEKVFINMAAAYRVYQEILHTLKSEEVMTLQDLVKLIRNDYDHEPEKAGEFVNGWFDTHMEYYYAEVLKSGLGSHLDQHKIYSLLTTDRKILFFKSMILICRKEKLYGFTAGAFMLGRFLCQVHPMVFWKAFDAAAVVFMLNEFIFFEKYIQVLNEFGERHLARTRNKILTDDLRTIALDAVDPETFLTLKLSSPDWAAIEAEIRQEHDEYLQNLVSQLKQPYGQLIDYSAPWSFEKIRAVCTAESTEIPDPGAV